MDRRALLGLTALAAAMRVVQAWIYHPWWCADTLLYAMGSERLQRGAWWVENDAGRPPLYPLVLASAQAVAGGPVAAVPSVYAAELVVAVQGLAWIAVVLLAADTARRLGAPRWAWMAVGVGLALTDGSASLERALQPMSFAAFFLTAWAWLLAGGSGLPAARRALYAGVCLGLACWLRSEALVLGVGWALASWRIGLVAGVSVATAGLAVAALVGINGVSVGYWGPSAQVDVNASCPVWDQWDGAAPEDALLGRIMVAEGSHRVDGVMDAFGALMAAAPELPVRRDLPLPTAVAAYVGDASRRLWFRRPGEYLRNAVTCLAGTGQMISPPPPAGGADPAWVGGLGVYRDGAGVGWAALLAAPGRIAWALVPLLVLVGAVRRQPYALGLALVAVAHCFLAAWFPRYGATFLPVAAIAASTALRGLNVRPRAG